MSFESDSSGMDLGRLDDGSVNTSEPKGRLSALNPKFDKPVNSKLQRRYGLAGVVLAILVIVADSYRSSFIGDFYWHLAAGDWMVKHGQVIHYNTFSYALGHTKWIADEWGYEWLLGELNHLFGTNGWLMATAGLGSVALVAVAYYLWLKGARGGRLGWLCVLAAFTLIPFVTQGRGLTMSLIWVPVELIILHKARTQPRWLIVLVPLMVVWINTHGSVLLGLAILVIELFWSLIRTSRLSGLGDRSTSSKLLAWTLGASVLACVITPYGWHLMVYDLGVSTNTNISALIVEWQPPDFHNYFILVAFLAMIGMLLRVAWLRKGPALDVTLAALFLVASAHSARFLVYALLITLALAAGDPLRIVARSISNVAGYTIAVVSVLILLAGPQFGKTDSSIPAGAFSYLAEPGHGGRVFTMYDWGGYSIWHGRQTYVDGRTDLFTSNGLLSNYTALAFLEKNPDPTLTGSHVRYVVWDPNSAMSTYLSADPKWHKVYSSPVAVVYESTAKR
jgi:hypothetical protein